MIAPVLVQRPEAVKQALSFLGKKEDPRLRSEVPLSPALDEEFKTMKASFTVTTGMLREITNRFQKELDAGLQKPKQNIVSADNPTCIRTHGSPPRNPALTPTQAMYPTWVFGFPSGHEKGQYLTIDLGGTNLRVCWITLKGQDHDTEVLQDTYRLPKSVKTGTADELWGLIADSLGDFLIKHDLKSTDDEP